MELRSKPRQRGCVSGRRPQTAKYSFRSTNQEGYGKPYSGVPHRPV